MQKVQEMSEISKTLYLAQNCLVFQHFFLYLILKYVFGENFKALEWMNYKKIKLNSGTIEYNVDIFIVVFRKSKSNTNKIKL